MALSSAQSAAFEKARAPGAGGQAVALSDSAVRALVAITARDLGIVLPIGIDGPDAREFYETAPHDVVLEGAASGLDALLQVGPRGLFQHEELSAEVLGSLLTLHKWMYDIDNRAVHETCYLSALQQETKR